MPDIGPAELSVIVSTAIDRVDQVVEGAIKHLDIAKRDEVAHLVRQPRIDDTPICFDHSITRRMCGRRDTAVGATERSEPVAGLQRDRPRRLIGPLIWPGTRNVVVWLTCRRSVRFWPTRWSDSLSS